MESGGVGGMSMDNNPSGRDVRPSNFQQTDNTNTVGHKRQILGNHFINKQNQSNSSQRDSNQDNYLDYLQQFSEPSSEDPSPGKLIEMSNNTDIWLKKEGLQN